MMTTEQLEEKVFSYRQTKRDLERLTKEEKAANEVLREELKARNTDELIVGVFKLTCKEYTRHYFDRKAFQEQWPDLFSTYWKSQTYKKLAVA